MRTGHSQHKQGISIRLITSPMDSKFHYIQTCLSILGSESQAIIYSYTPVCVFPESWGGQDLRRSIMLCMSRQQQLLPTTLTLYHGCIKLQNIRQYMTNLEILKFYILILLRNDCTVLCTVYGNAKSVMLTVMGKVLRKVFFCMALLMIFNLKAATNTLIQTCSDGLC